MSNEIQNHPAPQEGYACLHDTAGWCGFLHPTLREAVLCNHEHFARDERNDRLFFRAWWSGEGAARVLVVDSATLHECLVAMEQDPILCTRLDRAKDWWASELDRSAQLRAVIGPRRHVELADAAERAAHPTAPWFVPRRREAARSAYAASLALIEAKAA